MPAGGHFQRTTHRRPAYTHDCTVLADSSHGDSHVGSVSPAATRTLTLALTLTRTLTLGQACSRGGICLQEPENVKSDARCVGA